MNSCIFIKEEDFENLPFHLFTCKKDELLYSLFEYIKRETSFNYAVPYNLLIKKLKEIKTNDFILFFTKKHHELRPEESVNEMVDKSIKRTFEKLEHYQYLGKISEVESNGFRNAIIDISLDLLDGGINRGLYKYLEPYLELNKNIYDSKYHAIADYLVRVLKNEIKTELKKNEITWTKN